jgi:hypothetical protein
MDYSSTGLGRRSAIYIAWKREEVDLAIQDGATALSAVSASLARLELPQGEKVILSGETRPPIVWRYVSILGEQDFRDILKVATSREVVLFLTDYPGRETLFLKLTGRMALFFGRYLGVWLLEKAKESVRKARRLTRRQGGLERSRMPRGSESGRSGGNEANA